MTRMLPHFEIEIDHDTAEIAEILHSRAIDWMFASDGFVVRVRGYKWRTVRTPLPGNQHITSALDCVMGGSTSIYTIADLATLDVMTTRGNTEVW